MLTQQRGFVLLSLSLSQLGLLSAGTVAKIFIRHKAQGVQWHTARCVPFNRGVN